MLGVGQFFPEFNLKAVSPGNIDNLSIDNVFDNLSNMTYKNKWFVVFFYPQDFTFVCPTEIAAFGYMYQQFQERNVEVIGGSTDSEFAHWAWRKQQQELKNLPFSLIADVKHQLCNDLGILDKLKGVAQRATFIVDPTQVIRHVSVNDLNVGRNPAEILRILDALQTAELCPCNWNRGEGTIDIKAIVK